MTFKDRFTELRVKADLTQQEIATILHSTRSTIAGYEKQNREPKYEILIQIADFFDVSVDYLIGRTNEPKPIFIPARALRSDQRELLVLYEKLGQINRAVLLERGRALLDMEAEENDQVLLDKKA